MQSALIKSLISAHHNYKINGALTPGFLVGDPDKEEGFYLLADVLLPGESTARISGRIFAERGVFLFELVSNRIIRNPGKCTYKSTVRGFSIHSPSGDTILDIATMRFANGYVTVLEGRLCDEKGVVRMRHEGPITKVYGDCQLVLRRPWRGDYFMEENRG